jgi:beta-N-acetylhexosaminidase
VDACKGLIDAGLIPVIKHMPGHGRAHEDSHYHLPVVKAPEAELLKDLESFKIAIRSGLDIAGMTCHVIYECWDKDKPATLSELIIQDIIRGEIGFKGLLFSDDLIMKALDCYGGMIDRVHASLAAGCDIAVPCHTSMDQTKKILESL